MEKIIIDGREISYRKYYRRVKSPRLEFENGILTVILPLDFPDGKKLLERHKKWIIKQLDSFERLVEISSKLSLAQNPDMGEFKKKVSEKIWLFAGELDVRIEKIIFKKLKSRWGSCSTDGQVTVNTLLVFLPKRLTDYILFHEVVHRVERGHNKRFYGIVRKRFNDRKLIERELNAYWHLIKQNH